MKTAFENIELIKNETDNRFELNYQGHVAFIDYKETANQIALVHTEAPEALAGTGAAAALVEKSLIYIEASGKKLGNYIHVGYKNVILSPLYVFISSTSKKT